VSVKLSVITPTFGRPEFLPAFYAGYAAQTLPDTELLVFDDSPHPSPFMQDLRDDRVRYHHQPERVSSGDKRNWMVERARGELIAHFDDDDHYTPRYLETMCAALGDAALVKLSSWYCYSHNNGAFAYWDAARLAPVHHHMDTTPEIKPFFTGGRSRAFLERFSRTNLYGYGFTYLYRRSAWEAVKFPPLYRASDIVFADGLTAAGLSIKTVPDVDGIVLYIRHPHDLSAIFPQYLLPGHLLPRIFGAEVTARLDSTTCNRHLPSAPSSQA
jgi:glycosyltransferase involved in cell wall biosynthesis